MTCACGLTCVCHSGGAFPPPCPVPGGCGLGYTADPHQPAPTPPTCAAGGCDNPPDPVLCAGHARQLGDRLASIGARYQTLDPRPSMQAPAAGVISGGSLASHRSVGLLHVMALRDRRTAADPDSRLRSIPAVLFAWAEQVREQRQITRPRRRLPATRVCGGAEGPVCATWCQHPSCIAGTLRATAPVPRTVKSERKLLADQLPWILDQDWAGVFWAEIDELWALLPGTGGGDTPPVVGRCRAPHPRGGRCGGPLTWDRQTATCTRCGRTAQGLDVIRETAA